MQNYKPCIYHCANQWYRVAIRQERETNFDVSLVGDKISHFEVAAWTNRNVPCALLYGV